MIDTFSPPTQHVLLPTKKVIGFSITALPFKDQIQTILRWAISRESRTVSVANVHMLMEAYGNPEFADVLENADIVTPDGMPLVWMMRQMGASNQDRVAGMDILLALAQLAQPHNVSVFFVGSQTEILEQMRRRLEREFPNLQIAGMEPLPFRPLTQAEDQALIEKINESGAGLVLVSLGCPKQEHWIAQHKGKIQAVMIGLGGAFPVYAGIHKWAPIWVRKSGLEWLYRLVQEPRRLWSRYSKTIPPFIWLALKQLLMTQMEIQHSRF
ncbi:MAG: WecB/TagA/CpsF family glycosyltransferase [Aphanothece sp. CMT-3BRIN-NPC111]|jgi:N-acetylglucosaminyldiphosphoundecaprenol N-acetyl-beta-D-mannosaminyltransferase|nr:WecB/TagA/CpsF family glycosyltransferase [Aphanothece sp. CMT-3BRIN-NPC111]